MSNPNKRIREWCLTINNYSKAEHDSVVTEPCRYVVAGIETGETCGTPHLQCYIAYKDGITFSQMKKRFPRANLSERYQFSTPQLAADYCKKGEQPKSEWFAFHEKGDHWGYKANFIQKGELPKQGKRNDLDVVRDMIMDGQNMRDVALTATSYQSIRVAEVILKYHEPPRNWVTEVYWFYGPPGSGKSQAAKELLQTNIYSTMSNGKWFEGYDAHENVIIDDIRSDWLKFTDLLKLIGEHEYRVETKGGSRQFVAKKIVITAPLMPSEMFRHLSDIEDLYQLTRRLKEIHKFTYNSTFRKHEPVFIEH